MRTLGTTDYLDIAQLYASKLSGCKKVQVGCAIVKEGQIISLGANRGVPDLCQYCGCFRVTKYGDDSKSHRNPEDCRAIHSEIDALSQLRESARGASIYVTRYPCEGCAKAIIAAGIGTVYYGGSAAISEQTRDMFGRENVNCFHIRGWKEDNSDR